VDIALDSAADSPAESAAGLTDFSRACLAAVVSMNRPGGAGSTAFSDHILGLLAIGGRST
jgi:hypothetical protein